MVKHFYLDLILIQTSANFSPTNAIGCWNFGNGSGPVTSFEQWTMLEAYLLMFKSGGILIRREDLHHCDCWCQVPAEFTTKLVCEQVGVTAVTAVSCPRTVSSQHTNSQLLNEYTKLGRKPAKNKAQIIITGHRLNWGRVYSPSQQTQIFSSPEPENGFELIRFKILWHRYVLTILTK